MSLPPLCRPIQFHPPWPTDPEQVEAVLSIAGIECRFGAGLLEFASPEPATGPRPTATSTAAQAPVAAGATPLALESQALPAYAGEGWLGDRLRAFRVYPDGDGRRVEFGAGMVFRISGDGCRIDCLSVPSDAKLRSEWLLGPALLLALAARRIYALHASAISQRAGVVLLLGRSGSGKSTLARVAAACGWAALADDVVPLAETGGVLRVRPRFPQLKWTEPLATADCELPLAALVFVERGAARLALTPLPASIATRNLVRDTVAARLFAPAELGDHLAFCARLAEAGPCLRLDLPEVTADRVEATAGAALDLISRRLAV